MCGANPQIGGEKKNLVKSFSNSSQNETTYLHKIVVNTFHE
jgi:hypothetical protein